MWLEHIKQKQNEFAPPKKIGEKSNNVTLGVYKLF